MPLNIWIRFICYGIAGWSFEIIFTGIKNLFRSRFQDRTLFGKTYLWMFPIYGLSAFIFEPLHNAMRTYPWPARGIVYVIGLYAVEFTTGWLLRTTTGKCPWDYSRARHHFKGLIRWDYAPVWFLFCFGLEWLHDLLLQIRIQ